MATWNNKGDRWNDANGRAATGTVTVDSDGYAVCQFSINNATPALSTSYTLVTCDGAAGFGSTAPTNNEINRIKYITAHLDTLVTGATLTAKVTEDSSGDLAIWESSAVSLITGQTTANDASANFTIAAEGFPCQNSGAAWYVWLKLDAGTANVNSVTAYWNH